MIDWPEKGPAEVLNYKFEWAAVLQAGETIVSRVVTAVGVTIDSNTIAGSDVTVRLSGGTEGDVARVTCRIVTSATQTFEEVAILPIGGGPVSLATIKAHLRVDFDTEDVLIAAYLRAAVGTIERLTGRVLSGRVVEQRIDGFPVGQIALWNDPVREIVSVIYDDADGVATTIDPGDYRVVAGEPFLLLPAVTASWPTPIAGKGSVRVRALAGYLPGQVPPELIAAVLLMVGHLYSNREAVSQGGSAAAAPAELPLGVKALCFPFRRVVIG